MDELKQAVRELDAALRAVYAAQTVEFEAAKAVALRAREAGVSDRVVIVVGKVGWYIDPDPTSDLGYKITFGSVPEVIEGE